MSLRAQPLYFMVGFLYAMSTPRTVLAADGSTEPFRCAVCKADRNRGPCSMDTGIGTAYKNYSHFGPECATKTCYAVFSLSGGDDHFRTLGCTDPRDSDQIYVGNAATPYEMYPVFSPVPLPELQPTSGQFACRRNGAEPGSDIGPSMSCFCFTSICQMYLVSIATNKMFEMMLRRTLPEDYSWNVVDRFGLFVSKSSPKTYDKLSEMARRPFSCGECPCRRGKDCPSTRRFGNCTIDSPYSYAIETPCDTKPDHCYLMFGVQEKGDRVDLATAELWVPYGFTSKGCANDWTGESYAYYYAYPVPFPVPELGQWACRRHSAYKNMHTSISCFCYTSNCQTAHDPGTADFKREVIASLADLSWINYVSMEHIPAQYTNWVIVDLNGRKVPLEATTAWSLPRDSSSSSQTSSDASSEQETGPLIPPVTDSMTEEQARSSGARRLERRSRLISTMYPLQLGFMILAPYTVRSPWNHA